MTKSTFIILFHCFLAVLFLPVYLNFPAQYKLITAPYVAYLVFSQKADYFPALLIHFLPGTMISIFILVCCLILTLYHARYWFQIKLKWLFILLLIPLPIVLWQTYERIFIESMGLVDSSVRLASYLGFFSFFYGIVISSKMTTKVWVIVFTILLCSIFTTRLGLLESRYLFYALPLLISTTLSFYIANRSRFNKIFALIGLPITIMFGITLGSFGSLTIFFMTLGTFFIAYFYFQGFQFFMKLLSNKWFYFIPVLLVIWIVSNAPQLIRSTPQFGDSYQTLRITDFNELWKRIQLKAFKDRAPLWYSGWHYIQEKSSFFPPLELEKYERSVLREDHERYVSYGIHNVGLELLRQNGILVGGILLLTYFLIIFKISTFFKLKSESNLYVVIIASFIAVSIIGGLTGQFQIKASFSLLFFGFGGICYFYIFQLIKPNNSNGIKIR